MTPDRQSILEKYRWAIQGPQRMGVILVLNMPMNRTEIALKMKKHFYGNKINPGNVNRILTTLYEKGFIEKVALVEPNPPKRSRRKMPVPKGQHYELTHLGNRVRDMARCCWKVEL